MTLRAIVSIGTNSTRALVARIGERPEIVLQRSIGTRIGERLTDTGTLDPAAVERTLAALAEHVAATRPFTRDLQLIATSALRRASDAADFAQQASQVAGVTLRTISGEEEAHSSFAGAVSAIASRPGECVGVLDLGGGSAEYALGTTSEAERVISCEIGAVRLTERFPLLSGRRGAVDDATQRQARDVAMKALAPLRAFPRTARLVFAGGSATTAYSVLRGNREPFVHAPVARTQFDSVRRKIAARPLEERVALPGIVAQRADILLAGLLVLDAAFETVQHEHALVSTSDLLLGYLLRHPIEHEY